MVAKEIGVNVVAEQLLSHAAVFFFILSGNNEFTSAFLVFYIHAFCSVRRVDFMRFILEIIHTKIRKCSHEAASRVTFMNDA